MAGKTHVDNTVAERRLRPIYDWLDNGSNKKALQEAEKVLKKQPNFLCAKVLKGLALLRLGKEEECEQLLEAVRSDAPADDATLQAMAICYRETHQPLRICEIYEAAAKKDPTNEELITHLFMSYVRVADYKRQQTTALALYKLKPKNPYYFWAVMSVVMQAYKANADAKNAGIAKSVTLPLAERMVQKLVNEGKIEAEQEVQLYLMILEMQGKFLEALHVLDGYLGEKLISYVMVPLKRAQLHMKLCNWREANHLFKEMLIADIDHWAYYQEYLTSAFNLLDGDFSETPSGDETAEPYADFNAQMCRDFLTRLQGTNRTAERPSRGPMLAMLELYRRVAERGDDAQAFFGDVIDLLMGYVLKFGDKPCCVADLKLFLPLVPAGRRAFFLTYVEEYVDLEAGQMPATLAQMQRHITSEQLARCLGQAQPGAERRLEQAAKLMAHYEHGFRFNGPVSPTEFGCNDAYALLISHTLYDVWCETGNSDHLLEALLVLEHALTFSPANFHCKLLKLRFYQLLGAGSAAHRAYEQLDIKHMQLDSMGYFHCYHVYTTGQVALASHLYDHTLKFFTTNYKDSIDHLTYSYKFGSFLKIEEFVEFRERLNNSLHYSQCSVEKLLLELTIAESHAVARQLLAGAEVEPARDTIYWDKLRDNRDLSVVIAWDPPEKHVADNGRAVSFSADMDLLRLRSLLLRCVAAAVELDEPSDAVSNGDIAETSKVDVLATLTGELTAHLGKLCERSLPELPKNVISLALPSRLFNYLPMVPPLDLLPALCALAQDDDASLAPAALATSDRVCTAVRQAAAAVAAMTPEEGKDVYSGRRNLMEFLVNVVEMISITALLCGVCHDLLKPRQAPRSKKGKKKKNTVAIVSEKQTSRHESLNRLLSDLASSAEQLDSCLNSWEKMTPTFDLPSAFSAVKLASTVAYRDVRSNLVALVLEQVNDSHSGSLRELRQIVQSKVKYLNAMKI